MANFSHFRSGGKDVGFYLDTDGGAVVLQRMARNIVHNSAEKIAQAAMAMSGSSSGHTASLSVVGEVQGSGRGGGRYVAKIVANDAQSEAQMRHGNYIAKAKSAGRI